ncbi:MAG: hypothetical protein RIC87_23935 [Kiloniellales bacterium]
MTTLLSSAPSGKGGDPATSAERAKEVQAPPLPDSASSFDLLPIERQAVGDTQGLDPIATVRGEAVIGLADGLAGRRRRGHQVGIGSIGAEDDVARIEVGQD